MHAGESDWLYRDREVTSGLGHRLVERDECQCGVLGDGQMQRVSGANTQRMMVGHHCSTIEMKRIDGDNGQAVRQERLPRIQHLRFICFRQRAGADPDRERTMDFGDGPIADEEAVCWSIAQPFANGCAVGFVNQCRYQHRGVEIVAQ